MTREELDALARAAKAAQNSGSGQAQVPPQSTSTDPDDLAELARLTARANRKLPLKERIVDNLWGLDNEYESTGEAIGSWINRAIESGTLGIVGDESNAAVRAATTSTTYDDALAGERRRQAEFQARHPVGALSADLSGALVPGVGLAKAAKTGTTVATKVGLGMLSGGAQGTVAGFAEGEGGAANRTVNAGITGVIGSVLGGAVPAGGAAVRGLHERFGKHVQGEAREAAKGLGLRPKVAQLLADAIERDRPYAAETLGRIGPDARVAETGINTTQLADMVANTPGAGTTLRRQIDDLATERSGRFVQALDDTMGQPQGAARRASNLMSDTAEGRQIAYDTAYDSGIDWGHESADHLDNLLTRIRPNITSQADDALASDGHKTIRSISKTTDDGVLEFSEKPSLRQLDYIARALDGRAEQLAARGGGVDQGIAFANLSRELRNTLGAMNPVYREALDKGASTIKNREAIEFGSKLLQPGVRRDQVETMVGNMSPSERTFAIQGLRDQIDDIMAGAKRALTDSNMDARETLLALGTLGTQAGRAKVTALLGDDAAKVLTEADRAYSALSLRANTARNSATQPRQALAQQMDDAHPVGVREALLEGRGISGATSQLASKVLGDPTTARTQAQIDAWHKIGDALMRRADDDALSTAPDVLRRAQVAGGFAEDAGTSIAAILAALEAQRSSRGQDLGRLFGGGR